MMTTLPSSLVGWWILATALLLIYVLIQSFEVREVNQRLRRALLRHGVERAARIDAQKERDSAKKSVEETFIAVTPLIEKTDWMTGRWGGQFNTLVAMENTRNATVDKVRKRLLSLPQIDEQIKSNPADYIPTMQGAPLP